MRFFLGQFSRHLQVQPKGQFPCCMTPRLRKYPCEMEALETVDGGIWSNKQFAGGTLSISQHLWSRIDSRISVPFIWTEMWMRDPNPKHRLSFSSKLWMTILVNLLCTHFEFNPSLWWLELYKIFKVMKE